MSAQFVSGNELSRHLGISSSMVYKYRDQGLFIPVKNGKNVSKFNLETCRAAYAANRDPESAMRGIDGGNATRREGSPPPNALPENSLTRARTAQATLRAQREHLSLQRDKGELIKTEHAFLACRAVISIVLERLDGAAAQIGARVAGLDAVAAERVARDVLAAVRTEIAGMSASIEGVADAATR